ncbi:unnamed protein product [Discula destructiva]
MAATPTTTSGEVTVTVTSAPDVTPPVDTESSTVSLIYLYSSSVDASEPTSASQASKPVTVNGGRIAGIVIGALLFLLLITLALFFFSRKATRRQRAELAAYHPSPSRSAPASTPYGHVNAPSQGVNSIHTNCSSQYSQPTTVRSVGPRSTGQKSPGQRSTGQKPAGNVRLSLTMSPGPMPSYPPPATMPTSSIVSSQESVRLVSVVRKPSRPDVAEMYGSYTHPVELHGGSPVDPFAGGPASDPFIGSPERTRMRAAPQDAMGRGVRWDDRDSDAGSHGFMTSDPGWHSSSGASVSDGTGPGTETEYEYGGGSEHGAQADGASIHIYYRKSAATIAQAMSQASRSNQKVLGKSTMRNDSSQWSLADTAR